MADRSGPMACPVDGTTLVMSERQNIEIDYCPACRGVWLDRGELDKIIERATAESGAQAPAQPAPAPAPPPTQGYAPPPQPQYAPQPQYGDPYRGHDPRYGHKPHKRRKSFLEELFD
jgi:Zn-finger nucleic acid-binding protein